MGFLFMFDVPVITDKKKRDDSLDCDNFLRHVKHGVCAALSACELSYSRYKTLRKKYPQFAEQVDEIVYLQGEKLVDLAEAKLYEKLQEGDSALIKYTLSTKGKDRGYGVDTKVTHSFQAEDLPKDALADIARMYLQETSINGELDREENEQNLLD